MSTDDESQAFKLWCRYYLETEEYDRSLPHVMAYGEATPLPQYRDESTSFARRALRVLGLSTQRQGCHDASKLSLESLRENAASDDQIGLWLGIPQRDALLDMVGAKTIVEGDRE